MCSVRYHVLYTRSTERLYCEGILSSESNLCCSHGKQKDKEKKRKFNYTPNRTKVVKVGFPAKSDRCYGSKILQDNIDNKRTLKYVHQ